MIKSKAQNLIRSAFFQTGINGTVTENLKDSFIVNVQRAGCDKENYFEFKVSGQKLAFQTQSGKLIEIGTFQNISSKSDLKKFKFNDTAFFELFKELLS